MEKGKKRVRKQSSAWSRPAGGRLDRQTRLRGAALTEGELVAEDAGLGTPGNSSQTNPDRPDVVPEVPRTITYAVVLTPNAGPEAGPETRGNTSDSPGVVPEVPGTITAAVAEPVVVAPIITTAAQASNTPHAASATTAVAETSAAAAAETSATGEAVKDSVTMLESENVINDRVRSTVLAAKERALHEVIHEMKWEGGEFILEIPLCRLRQTHLVRSAKVVTPVMYSMFSEVGFGSSLGKFIVSPYVLGTETMVDVTDKDLEFWDAIWHRKSEEFDLALQRHEATRPFVGKMFHIVDGNHRWISWMRCIFDKLQAEGGSHISVSVSIFVARGIEQLTNLRIACHKINQLSQFAFQEHTLVHDIEHLRFLGSLTLQDVELSYDKDTVKAVRTKLASMKGDTWYTMPPDFIVGVWAKTNIKASQEVARRSGLEGDQLDLELLRIEQKILSSKKTKIMKLLTIADTNRPQEWMECIAEICARGKSARAPEEMIYNIAKSKLSFDKQAEVLRHLSLWQARNEKGLDTKVDALLVKNVYIEQTVTAGESILEDWLSEMTDFCRGVSFEEYVRKSLDELGDGWIPEGATDTAAFKKQPGQPFFTKRAVYRYLINSEGAPRYNDDIFKKLLTGGTRTGMYEDGFDTVSKKEKKICPWYLELPSKQPQTPFEIDKFLNAHPDAGIEAVQPVVVEHGEHVDTLATKDQPDVGQRQGKRKRRTHKAAEGEAESCGNAEPRPEQTAHHSVAKTQTSLSGAHRMKSFIPSLPTASDADLGNLSTAAFHLEVKPLSPVAESAGKALVHLCKGDYMCLPAAIRSRNYRCGEYMELRGWLNMLGKGTGVDFMFFDLPDGLTPVDGDVPPWNVFTDEHILSAMELAAFLLNDKGTLVVVVLTDLHSMKVMADAAEAFHFHEFASGRLLSSVPAEGRRVDGSTHKVYTWNYHAFCKEADKATAHRDDARAARVLPGYDSSTNIIPNIVDEDIEESEYPGFRQRSPRAMQILLELFCPSDGIVLDGTAGFGSMVGAALDSGRSVFALERDAGLDKVLKGVFSDEGDRVEPDNMRQENARKLGGSSSRHV